MLSQHLIIEPALRDALPSIGANEDISTLSQTKTNAAYAVAVGIARVQY